MVSWLCHRIDVCVSQNVFSNYGELMSVAMQEDPKGRKFGTFIPPHPAPLPPHPPAHTTQQHTTPSLPLSACVLQVL